ncbi:MAG TPA: type II secretion system F family protein [Steroidobacteraceae bacterium]|nr:type II secretion system F family protein [Steroidobacteraceae bacterium]
MSQFLYSGRSPRGEPVNGSLEAESEEAAAARLQHDGVTPISIVASLDAPLASAPLTQIARRMGLGKPKTADLVLFTRQMYTIVKSGIPLLRGLRGLASSTHNVVLRRALEDVLHSLEAGRDLATSFARHPELFPEIYLGIIAVGEATGTLEAAFLRLSDYLSQERDMQVQVKAALRYPIMVIVAIAVAIGIITTFVMPRFAPLFRVLGNDIPLPTRIIMDTAVIARRDWYWVLAVGAALFVASRAYVRTVGGRLRWHKLLLGLPVVGPLVRQAALARLSRTLSIALTAGMPMLETLAIIARVCGNDYLARRMLRLRDRVERGEPLSRAAAGVRIFPPLVLQMLAVGEETGELPQLLDEVAGFYEREVEYSLSTLSAAIEPILIVLIGGMVLILALGVFLPMWNMIAKVGAGH